MSANLQQRGRPQSFGTEQPQETASTMSQTGFGLPRFKVIDFFAGYAASGLTQPKASPAYAEKIHANKVGWDKWSVPNMFVKKHQMFSISCWIFAWNPPLDRGGFLGHIGAE